MAVTIRKNNLSPSLFDTIRQGGVAFDLTASTVKLQARDEDGTTLIIDAAAAIITASTTLATETVLPEPSITAASASGFLAKGALTVGSQVVEYEEISGNTFLGCRGGDGTIATGATVSQRGGVRYDWVAADVDEALDLEGWWRVVLPSAKVQETPTFPIFIVDPLAAEKGLCELGDVLSYARGYRSDSETDALLERLIMAKTRQIQRETHTEFVPTSSATRRFDISSWNIDERKVYVGALSGAPSAVRIIDDDQTTVLETVASTSYVALPYARESWQPIEALKFPTGTTVAAGLGSGLLLEVVGVWGHPNVPEDIREACAALVISDYVSNPALSGTTFAEALEGVNVSALFASARRVIDSYRPKLVAWY